MASQVRGTFPELYDNVEKTLKSIIKDALQELQPIWKDVFNVRTSNLKFERIVSVTPFGDVPEKPEGEVYALDVIQPGWTKDFTHLEFGLGFEVTETALEDDQYDQLIRAAEMLAFSARYVQEKKAADVFNNGFSTEKTPDGGGTALFSSSHALKRGGTASNLLSPAADLSPKALMDAMINVQTETKIESGQLVAPVKDWLLYIPPALEFTADRIVNSTGMPSTAENDRNPIKARRNIRIIVNPHLSDTDAFFLVAANKKQHGITSYVRKPISNVPAAIDPFTGNKIIKIRFRQSWGAWMWQGAYASQGA